MLKSRRCSRAHWRASRWPGSPMGLRPHASRLSQNPSRSNRAARCQTPRPPLVSSSPQTSSTSTFAQVARLRAASASHQAWRSCRLVSSSRRREAAASRAACQQVSHIVRQERVFSYTRMWRKLSLSRITSRLSLWLRCCLTWIFD